MKKFLYPIMLMLGLLALGSPVSFAQGHRYWRIYVTGGTTTGRIRIPELKMYDASGTYLNVGGTASSNDAADGAALQAFDGSVNTYWGTTPGDTPTSGNPKWLEYDFGSG